VISRRALLAAALAAAAFGVPATAAVPQRLAVLDWALAELALMLGLKPIAVAEMALYGKRVGEPALPAGATDVGLRSQPSLELLASLRPDLILTLSGYGPSEATLSHIAPTWALSLYTPDRAPLEKARQGLISLGAVTDRVDAAGSALAGFEMRMAALRERAAPFGSRPILVLNFADERHADVYGHGSLFGDALVGLGLANAWQGTTNAWGFTMIGLDEIAARREAHVLLISPGAPADLETSALWHSVPAVRAGRVSVLPPVWQFGALVSAERFAMQVVQALEQNA
jgi:ABC-type Fe3+-hydroxamate transport system substrate-binding protein